MCESGPGFVLFANANEREISIGKARTFRFGAFFRVDRGRFLSSARRYDANPREANGVEVKVRLTMVVPQLVGDKKELRTP